MSKLLQSPYLNIMFLLNAVPLSKHLFDSIRELVLFVRSSDINQKQNSTRLTEHFLTSLVYYDKSVLVLFEFRKFEYLRVQKIVK